MINVQNVSKTFILHQQNGVRLPVLQRASLTVNAGECVVLHGHSGSGKSTLLRSLYANYLPDEGQIQIKHGEEWVDLVTAPARKVVEIRKTTIGWVSQFLRVIPRISALEVVMQPLLDTGVPREACAAKAARLLTRLNVPERLWHLAPSTFSGGEQQRAALAKVLLLGPEILLLDEPTKGLDAEFKQTFAEILQTLLRQEVALLMVSHDIEFCARYAHRCALFFDGSIVTEAPPRAFFSGNSFYTTSANRMARGLLPEAVTAEDVILACGGTLPPVPELPDRREPLPEPEESGAYSKPKPLTWWRKLGAALTGAMAFLLFLSFMNITDLTKLITAGGMTELANHQMFLYALFILSLFLFAACITRRSHRKDYVLQVPRAKRKLAKRTIVAAVLILLLIPLTLYIGVFYLGNKKYYFISLMVLLECMLPFFLIFEGRKPQARELVIIAVLCAIGIAGRAAFFMLPQFKPVMALTIVAGVAFGGETGFLVGAMTMLASNVLFGQGPLTPWQMFAMGIIGFLAGLLFRKGLLRRNRGALCVFGALAAILIYGGIMNPASALTWVGELNEKVLLTYYISGLPFDCIQAAATWLFLWFGAEPMLEKLDRIKVKYGMVEV